MTESSTAGVVDLETELTCGVCTEILYQPLTLLDCLHTFCGACLKLWFQSQAARARSSTGNPYTCLACRKPVRAAISDARINTLLDLYLQANPGKSRSEEDKKELAGKYTKGEDILVKRPGRVRNHDDEADRRMVEEVRQMSLEESNPHNNRHGYERGVRHRQRSRDQRAGEGRSRSSAENDAQAIRLERQSSLRRFISAEELNPTAMREEILRQIQEEDLLDGIDLSDPAQEEELCERIADAYRRRQGRGRGSSRQRSASSRANGRSSTTASRTRVPSSRATSITRTATAADTTSDSASSRRHARSVSATDEPRSSHPPVSRPHLLDADSASVPSRRRRSNESRRQTSPNPRTASVQQQAARSATDLSGYDRANVSRDPRPSIDVSHRRNTDPRHRRQSDTSERSRPDLTHLSPRNNSFELPALTASDLGPRPSSRHRPSAIEISRAQIASAPTTPRIITPTVAAELPAEPLRTAPLEHMQLERPKIHIEISVSCDRCGKEHIEYDLHEHCSICKDGNYNLCHQCYREGKGCLHWFGFGDNAWFRFQRGGSQQQPPHALIGRCYGRPKPGSIQHGQNNTTMTTDDPAARLQSGAFCSICYSYADDCFWKCNSCNEGEWGFCNRCVNTGKCCTHALLPLANISTTKPSISSASTPTEASFAPITSPSMVQTYPPVDIDSSNKYRPLTFSTNCNICHYPIQPSQSRFHCYHCQNGDYDICNVCYAKLVDTSRISRENSDRGWRRCLKDHRMVKIWFEDSPKGQRRVVVNDLVGGWFLEDNQRQQGEWSWVEGGQRRTRLLSRRMFDEKQPSSAALAVAAAASESVLLQKFPPDGGVGLCLRALYARIPAAGANDELGFPRGAEIREGEEISNDWMQGSYAGEKGLFPKNHVEIVGQVTM